MARKAKAAKKETYKALQTRFTAYTQKVSDLFRSFRYPKNQLAFSVTGYTGDKKPNTASIPELIAIVGTALKLNQKVELRISGRDNGATLDFYFVEKVPDQSIVV